MSRIFMKVQTRNHILDLLLQTTGWLGVEIIKPILGTLYQAIKVTDSPVLYRET